MEVQEVRWDKGGSVTAGVYDFFNGKVNFNQQLGTGCLVHRRIVSALNIKNLLALGCHI